jgi:hypothetical protein
MLAAAAVAETVLPLLPVAAALAACLVMYRVPLLSAFASSAVVS